MNQSKSMLKKVVVIAGGNGSAITIKALKPYFDKLDVSAVVSVCDAGGANGELRKELQVLPSADILRAAMAMSPYEYKTLKKIFRTNRFKQGKYEGHYLGNLFIMALAKQTGQYIETLRSFEDAVEAMGKVYPVTLELADLCVELSNGNIVIGEDNIDRPTYNRKHTIKRAWMQPTPPLYNEAQRVIEEADYIIFGPGSLYTSIIATLVIEGMKKKALRNSKATFIFIAGNSYETHGETGPTTLSDSVAHLETYLPRPIDYIVYNGSTLNDTQKERYQKKHWGIIKNDMSHDPRVITKEFEKKVGGLNTKKLGNILNNIIE